MPLQAVQGASQPAEFAALARNNKRVFVRAPRGSPEGPNLRPGAREGKHVHGQDPRPPAHKRRVMARTRRA